MMIKILYVGNVLDSTGYSYAIEDAVKALSAVRIPVALRHIDLCGHPPRKVGPAIKKALESNSNDANVLIIHGLPNYFEYDGRFKKCIGRFDIDTVNLKPSNWLKKCQLMDEVWVSRDTNLQLNKSQHVIPHPFDPMRTSYNLEPGLIARNNPSKKYTFYTIGEFVERKNYETLLRVWYTTFSNKDNVQLVIKTGANDLSSQRLIDEFQKMAASVREAIRLNPKHLVEPILVTDKLTPLAIDQLHNDCDCFISASHGEGFCIPARDALAFGNKAILPFHTGFLGYKFPTVEFINVIKTTCYEAFNKPRHILSSYDYWYDLSSEEFSLKMKGALAQKAPKNPEIGELVSNTYSYENVGLLMKNRLT